MSAVIRVATAVAVSALLAWPARADALILTGGEYGAHSSYAYVGAIVPLPGQALGSGFGMRLWGDYVGYDYASGPSTVEAAGWGGELAAVYQLSGAWGWSNFSAGVRYRDTELSPDDPNNAARGAKAYLTLQIDGAFNVTSRWRLRGIANYTSTIDGYFVQPAIDRALSDSLRVGIDATFQGDKSYKQVAAGLNLTVAIDPRRSFGIRAGASDNGNDTGLYGGVSLAWTTN
jgi:hypothetical protein